MNQPRTVNGEPISRELYSLITCICGRQVDVAERRDGMVALTCRKCNYTRSYPEEVPWFKELVNIRGLVLVPGFLMASTNSNVIPARTELVKEQELKIPLYTCKNCGEPISKEQALESYERELRALCEQCEGA